MNYCLRVGESQGAPKEQKKDNLDPKSTFNKTISISNQNKNDTIESGSTSIKKKKDGKNSEKKVFTKG